MSQGKTGEQLDHSIFEADIHDGLMEGFTENYVRVVAKYDPLLVNELKQVQLTTINEDGLVEVEEPEMVYETH